MTTEINTRAEAEEAIKRGARLAALLKGAEAARDTAVVRAQKTNSKRIAELSKEVGEIVEGLATWAKANRSEFTGQSMVSDFGSLNFRVGNPEVSVRKGWTLKRVLAVMVISGRVVARWKSFVRIKFELHRANILSAYSKQPDATQTKLLAVGLEVVKNESFDVEFGVKQKL